MKRKGWFIGASIFGMVMTGSAGVYAGSNLPEIKALLNNKLGIFVNSTEFKPVDGNGSRIYPITYNSVTYLPVRAVSQALDVPITYDAKLNRVIIGNNGNGGPTVTPPPAVSFQRPKHLPADFPLPADTKKVELIENADGSRKGVNFTLQTKESLKTWIETYNTYLQNRGYTGIVDTSKEGKIDITANKTGESVVIEGEIIDANTGLAEYTIIWSAS